MSAPLPLATSTFVMESLVKVILGPDMSMDMDSQRSFASRRYIVVDGQVVRMMVGLSGGKTCEEIRVDANSRAHNNNQW